jgi:hypothetical protein
MALVGAYDDDDNGQSSGSAYFFRWNGRNWVQEQKLLASDGAEFDKLGYSVSVSGDVALVGARLGKNNGQSSGAAYVYTLRDLLPPVITVPGDITREATGPSGAIVYYPDITATDNVSVVSGPSCDPLSGSMFPLDTTTVTCTASDAAGNIGSATFTVTVQDTTSPVITLPQDIIVEPGVPVYFSYTVTDLVDPAPMSRIGPISPGGIYPPVKTRITCTANDFSGNRATAYFYVFVTSYPFGLASGNITPIGGVLTTSGDSFRVRMEFPPGALNDDTDLSITESRTMFKLTTNLGIGKALYGVIIEPDGTTFNPSAKPKLVFFWPDLDNDGIVDGTVIPEAMLMITKNAEVITGECQSEPSCDTNQNSFSVQVASISNFALFALNRPPEADPNGPYLSAVGSPIVFDGTASSDPDGDTLNYDWDYGDTNTGIGATPSHAYADAGIYDLCLTVDDGEVTSNTACTIAVVYDPSAGFVTGGGWIDSPAGAYGPYPTLTGKANFGFVSKYKKGATVPTGQTEFQFHVADLDFHSDIYDWLVVTGSHFAKFKGTGTINGAGEYKFKIWAGDADPDTFRIKIWEEDEFENETVIYDNGFDQEIGEGSIVIYAKEK